MRTNSDSINLQKKKKKNVKSVDRIIIYKIYLNYIEGNLPDFYSQKKIVFVIRFEKYILEGLLFGESPRWPLFDCE